MPSRGAAGRAPYHDGRRAWVDPWGRTWIDDAPWGFAVSHCGRRANIGGQWGGIRGLASARAHCAPGQDKDGRGKAEPQGRTDPGSEK